MRFKAGESGNPTGRPVGAKNKSGIEAKNIVVKVLSSHFTPVKLKKDLLALDPKDRLNILIRLLDFVIPKMRMNDISFEKLPDDTLTQIINEILNSNETS